MPHEVGNAIDARKPDSYREEPIFPQSAIKVRASHSVVGAFEDGDCNCRFQMISIQFPKMPELVIGLQSHHGEAKDETDD